MLTPNRKEQTASFKLDGVNIYYFNAFLNLDRFLLQTDGHNLLPPNNNITNNTNDVIFAYLNFNTQLISCDMQIKRMKVEEKFEYA